MAIYPYWPLPVPRTRKQCILRSLLFYAYTVVTLHWMKWLPLSFSFILCLLGQGAYITVQRTDLPGPATDIWKFKQMFQLFIGVAAVSPTIRFANVLFANFWSHFSYVLGQFPNCFRLISGSKIEVYTCVSLFCIMTERTKHIRTQCSFRFVAEWHKTFPNGKLAKWLIGVTTGHHSITSLLWTWPVIG